MATTFVQFYRYGLDSAAGTHASPTFALCPGDCDDLLDWPFPETINLSDRDQLDPHNKWTVTFAPSKKPQFWKPTRDLCPLLTNSNFFPHSKLFSKTENFLLKKPLYLETKLTDSEPATFKP